MADTNSSPNGTFAPALTMEEVGEAEQKAQEWGVTRRCALATLTKSSDELLKSLADEKAAEAFLDVAEGIAAYLKWRDAETELLNAAQARILFVLNHLYGGDTEGGSNG
jgi:hypothetical protein